MSKTTLNALFLTACFLSTGTAVKADQPANYGQPLPIEKQLQEVVSRLVGIMDTSAQANSIADAPNVRITHCTITLEDAPKNDLIPITYLYQEQAISDKLSQPYRQRILKISPNPDLKTIESASYRPTNPQSLINLCNQPAEKRLVNFSEIGKSNCSVFLQKIGDDYIGETQPGGCKIDYRGAVLTTNKIILHSAGMDTWDRGFDSQGKLVWGAENRPYQFRKRSIDNP